MNQKLVSALRCLNATDAHTPARNDLENIGADQLPGQRPLPAPAIRARAITAIADAFTLLTRRVEALERKP